MSEEYNAACRVALVQDCEDDIRLAYWNAIADRMKDPVVFLIDPTDRNGRATLDALDEYNEEPGRTDEAMKKPLKEDVTRLAFLMLPYAFALEAIRIKGGRTALEAGHKRKRQIQYVVLAENGHLFGSFDDQIPVGE